MTVYESLIDLKEEEWTGTLKSGETTLGEGVWNYHNSVFAESERDIAKQEATQETIKDTYSKVDITDRTSDLTDIAHDYSLHVNDTFTLTDVVKILDSDSNSFNQKIEIGKDSSINKFFHTFSYKNSILTQHMTLNDQPLAGNGIVQDLTNFDLSSSAHYTVYSDDASAFFVTQSIDLATDTWTLTCGSYLDED